MTKKKLTIGVISIILLGCISAGGYILYTNVKADIISKITPNSIQETNVAIKDVNGLDLDKSQIDKSTITAFGNIFIKFQESLIDDDTFRGKLNNGDNVEGTVRSEYLMRLKPYMEDSYFISMANKEVDDVFISMIKQIYSINYRHIDSVTFVAIGKELYDDNEVYKAVIDVNAVDDKIGFQVQRVNIYMNKDKQMIKVEPVGGLHDQANTTTPLSDESSITINTHKEFLNELNPLLNKLKNKNIYSGFVEGKITNNSTEWKSYVSNLNIKDKDIVTLFNMLKKGKGEFNNWAIVAFSHGDVNVTGISTYTIQIADEKGVSNFNIDFSRTTNKIIKVSQNE